MNFLKLLFMRKKITEKSAKVDSQFFDAMSLVQVVEHLRSIKGSIPITTINCIHRRLHEIALYDHNVEQQTRTQAWQILETLIKDINLSYVDNPDYLRTLNEVSELMLSNVRFIGVGSLSWLIKEYDLPYAEIVPFVMKIEYGHLLADFLTKLAPEAITKTKPILVKHLILSRRYGECTNAVLTLHGLAAKCDDATVALFSESELAVLVGIPDDYISGRQILVNLGLLPEDSNALPFVPAPGTSRLIQQMAHVYKCRDEAVNADLRMQTADDEGRLNIMQTALAVQRLHLIRRMINQVHGAEMAKELLDVLSEGPARDISLQLDRVMAYLENFSARTQIDFMLLQRFMTIGGLKVVTEEDFEREHSWMTLGTDWLNNERVEVLNYMRYLLRWDTNYIPSQAKTDADESISEFVLKTYLEQGSKAGLAEKMHPYLEDWIGS